MKRSSDRLPRIGFLGVGWIGRHRMEAMSRAGAITVAAVADPDPECLGAALQAAPGARKSRTFDELLDHRLDGIVIATPSALHAEQAVRVLESGMAVFCQKPIGRTAEETRRVVETASRVDRLLGVDLSYRFVRGMRRIRRLIRDGAIGEVYAADLLFHNAYGPDKNWYYNPRESGGGCVIDLGIHLVDLALWSIPGSEVTGVSSRLYAGGERTTGQTDRVEDYAVARIDLHSGATINLACSWRLPAGCDCVIGATFYGTRGGVCLRNVNGSFYDFEAMRFTGTDREVLLQPPDDWGGRAAVAWAAQLANSARYSDEIESMVQVAQILDAIYGRTAPDEVPGEMNREALYESA